MSFGQFASAKVCSFVLFLIFSLMTFNTFQPLTNGIVKLEKALIGFAIGAISFELPVESVPLIRTRSADVTLFGSIIPKKVRLMRCFMKVFS